MNKKLHLDKCLHCLWKEICMCLSLSVFPLISLLTYSIFFFFQNFAFSFPTDAALTIKEGGNNQIKNNKSDQHRRFAYALGNMHPGDVKLKLYWCFVSHRPNHMHSPTI